MHAATIRLLEKRIAQLDRDLAGRELEIADWNRELNDKRQVHSSLLAEKTALESDLADAKAMTLRDGAKVGGQPMGHDDSLERKSRG